MSTIKTITLAASLCLSLSALAAPPLVDAQKTKKTTSAQNPSAIPTPAVLSKLLSTTGYTPIAKFSAPAGLTGWALSKGPGQNVVAYTPADNSVIFVGNILDADGKNLTREHADTYGSKVNYDAAWKTLDTLPSSALLTQAPPKGTTPNGNKIFVFLDPNCGYCHAAYKTLTPYVNAGLTIQWVPVAFLAKDSANKSAFLLNAPDKSAALEQLSKATDNRNDTTLAATISLIPTDAHKAILATNQKHMNDFGFSGTPALLYKDSKGVVKGLAGMPSESLLAEITGMTPPTPATTSN